MPARNVTPPQAWIVIADGGHARIVTLAGDGRGYDTLTAIDAVSAHLKTAALGSERPGRTGERGTHLRHAIQPRVDRHRQAKAVFAALVADMINGAVARGACTSFYLVAPSTQLTAMRAHLTAPARTGLSGTLAKDLTKVPDGKLASHLQSLPPPAVGRGGGTRKKSAA